MLKPVKTTNPLRVLMLLENNTWPEDDRVRREAMTLTGAGHRVTVVCPKREGQPSRELADGVRIYRFRAPAPGNGFFGYLWEYGYSLVACLLLSLRAFFREGFDVIHAHNPPDLFVLIAMLYKPFGRRFVFDHHDLSPEMYRARFQHGGSRAVFQALLGFEKLTCKLADHVISTNESYKTLVMERHGVYERNITIVRNGPDLDRIKLVDPDPEIRGRAGSVFGYLGIMGYQDGIDYLLRALSHLVRDFRRDDFYCVLVGEGDARADLMRLATELGLDHRVRFTGRISDEDMLRALSSTDICVDPDPSNPFNDRSTMTKIMEYMALARPIVAFDLPEHRASAGEAALYAEPNDEISMARQLIALMDDPERCQRLGELGRHRVETQLAWQFQEQHLLKAYGRLVGTP
ncbi:MAG: glycosyltransferase family 4 protein [Myxococcales bacterium]|nr:glycosyltransferase family 4 protein [Myxococcales bacterium]